MESAGMIVQLGAVAVAAIIFTLLYDPFSVGLLAFLALTPITIVFANPGQTCSIWRAGFLGFVFGMLASLAIVGPWMVSAALDYFGQGLESAVGFTLYVNAIYVAAFMVPAFMAIRLVAYAPPIVRVLGVPAIWTTFEWLRAMDPAGNPWAQLGQGFAYLPVLKEAASAGGMPLLGFLAGLCGAAIGIGMQTDVTTRASRFCMALGIGAPVLLALLGGLEAARVTDNAPLRPLRVAVVQAEIPSLDVWNPAKRMEHWNAYVAATDAIAPGSVDLVVWPESAAPFLLDADAAARDRINELMQKTGAAILLGAPRTEQQPDGHAALYNSAYFFAAGAPGPRTYDKRRLLPYVETTAMPGAELPAGTSYEAGDAPEYFELKGWRISPLLCFEAVYPQYAREAVLGGAHLLVNMSNDAWFAAGGGPEQHYAMSLMRTVELRRPMIRASNGGISGAFSVSGDEIGFLIRRHKAVGVYEIPAPPRHLTMAAEYPNAIPYLSVVIAIAAILTGFKRLNWPAPDLPPEEEDIDISNQQPLQF
jgi:apolipoprotein N-acyltransferase